MLPVGQEGRAGEEVRVPQRNLAAAQAVERELLPGGVLDGQVGDEGVVGRQAVSYTHLRAHETVLDLVCRLLLEKKKYETSSLH